MPSGAATNGEAQAYAQLNGVIAKDQDKQRVPVHTFDPDASPEEKASKAGKARDKLDAPNASEPGGKEVALTTGNQAPAIPPTITISDADKDMQQPDAVPAESLPPSGSKVPGALPEGAVPEIPDWFKIGWRAVGGIDSIPLSEGEAKDKAALDMFLSEQYYGYWWTNAAVMFFAVFTSHFMTLFHFGWGWLFLLLATCATYYSTSMKRVRRRARDDIQRELVKTRLMNDAESADWINNFLDRFWLIYEPVLSQTVIQSVDQILSINTPPFLDSLRLTTFTLGTKAPRINSVQTWTRTPEDVITMDWKFSFTPNDVSDMTPKEAARKVNPKIVLSVKVGKGFASAGMPILLEDMEFSGHLRIKLKLMTSFPHVQVVDLSFLEKPVFDYVLKPLGGEHFGFDIGNVPGLSAFIRDMVHSILGPMMYDPNVFTLNLEQMLSGAPIDTAIGVLQVTIHSARGLKGTKIGGGTPDPYVSLAISARQELARTKHKESTYNPSWGETKFLLINSLADTLTLSVYDWNEHRRDSELGTATFELGKLTEDATQEGLETKILKDGKDRGEIRYDVSFYPVLKPQKVDGKEEELPDTKVGIVRLTLHQAKDLDHTKVMSNDLNPFAKVLLSANSPSIYSTPKVRHTLNPVWESSTEFLCSDKHSSVVTVKVIDDRDFLKDPLIGYLSIKLDDLLEARKTAKDWWPLSGCKTGRLRMSAEWKPVDMAGSLHGADSYVPPIGIVRLWMRKATDVKNVEAALGGKSDPYVRVLVNGVTLARTEVVNNNLNPEWDQIVYIPVHSLKEIMLLECMDYQHLTKDRSLGSVELKVSELAKRAEDVKYPFASTGKKSYAEPIRLDRGNVYKGQLHYDAEFVPAIGLKWDGFQSAGTELDRMVGAADDDSDANTTGSYEREKIPDGVTTAKGMTEEVEDEFEEPGQSNGNAPMSRHQKKDSVGSVHTSGTANTTATGGTMETAASGPQTPAAIEMSKEELFQHQSGVVVFNVRGGKLSQKGRVEVLLDDAYWPAFSTTRARSLHAQWDHVGEGFIKELDFGRVWLRLNENDEGEKDDIIAEFKCDAKEFLDQTLNAPTEFTLTDQDGRKESVLEIEARYIPVDITLEPRESINNMGILRVDLIDGHQIRGVDRGGKSDPFVVFTLNDQKVFKSQTKKKTLTPEWNETFTVQVPSRVGSNFSLEVFDWNQIEQAKSLGTGEIELADLEPFEAIERPIKLSHTKHGEQGEIRVRMLFTPEMIAKSRKNTSTFSSAGRAMTQIGALPLGAGKGVFHGVEKVGNKVGGVFGRDHAKHSAQDETQTTSTTSAMPLAGQESVPAPISPSNSLNAIPTSAGSEGDMSVSGEPGTLKVTVVGAKDLTAPDGDAPKAYVVVRVGEKEHKTKHASKGMTPEWNETLAFPAGPSTPKASVKVYEHKTLGKDKCIGEAEVDIWRHIQAKAEPTAADVQIELTGGSGLLSLRLMFNALGSPTGKAGSVHKFGSPSRFSLSSYRRPGSDD